MGITFEFSHVEFSFLDVQINAHFGEVFKKFDKFGDCFFFSAPFLSFPLAFFYMYVDALNGVPQVFEALFIFPHEAFCSKDWIISVALTASLPILLLVQICCCAFLVKF